MTSAAETPEVTFALPPELLEAIAARAAELVEDQGLERPEPWIGVDAAAEYLACKRQRIYDLVSQGRIPHRREGTRLLFKRSELDEWLEREAGR